MAIEEVLESEQQGKSRLFEPSTTFATKVVLGSLDFASSYDE